LIVHDGTVTISSNLDKYHPEIKLKAAKVNLKPNSFSQDKILRATEAVENYQADKILSIDSILGSSEFPSLLMKSRKYGVLICDNSSNESSSKEEERLPNQSESSVKSIRNTPGKLKSILNENFGLIEFFSLSGEKSFCLFDTYDLYLEKRNTAAKRKVPLEKVLLTGDEVIFNACEVCPRSCVPWLANGVWKSDLANPPDPVPFEEISKEKLAVFEKVADTCALVLPSMDNFVDNRHDVIKEENMELQNMDCGNNSSVSEAQDANVKHEDENNNEGILMNDGEEVDRTGDELLDLTVNLHESDGEIIFPDEDKRDFAIIKFNCVDDESGSKVDILAHFSRIWLMDRPMNSTINDWDLLRNYGILNLQAHRVTGFQGFKYQLLRAIVTNGENEEEHDGGLGTFKEALSYKMDLLMSQLNEMKKNC